MTGWIKVICATTMVTAGFPSLAKQGAPASLPTGTPGSIWTVRLHANSDQSKPVRVKVRLQVGRSNAAPQYTNVAGTAHEGDQGTATPVWDLSLNKQIVPPQETLRFVTVKLRAPEPGQPIAAKPFVEPRRGTAAGAHFLVNVLPPKNWRIVVDGIRVSAGTNAVPFRTTVHRIPGSSPKNSVLVQLALSTMSQATLRQAADVQDPTGVAYNIEFVMEKTR